MEPDKKAYIAVMEEIKSRIEVVTALHARKIGVMYRATHVESMVLQVRMITELVALGSLAANEPLFEENRKKFEKLRKPKEILKDVEKFNPNFYPRPIVEVPLKNSLAKAKFVNLKTGFMARDELIQVHGRCGDLLHAQNPFGKDVDYGYYEKMVPEWMNRIIKLLNFHVIKPLAGKRFYRVHMQDAKDGRVHMQTFEQLESARDFQPNTRSNRT